MNKLMTAVLCIFLASCSLFDSKSAEVTFHIPDLPEKMQRLEVTSWRIAVTTADDMEEFTTQKNTFKVSVPVSGITAVLAYPVGRWGTLKPAGFIVHGNLKAHNFLTWNDGFAGECTGYALNSGYEYENFNFTLFQRKLIEKSDGNPWILNRDMIIYALSYGIFNMNYIRKAESHVLSLPFPGTGTWYSGTPGCIQRFEQAGGYINDLVITEGENIFINPATGDGITIYADRLTWICISGTTGGLSGSW